MKPMREASYYTLAALIDGPAHGYAALEKIRAMTGGRVKPTVGTLYGVLERLVDEGLIRRAGSEIVNGRARHYFELTDAGSAAVSAEAERMAADAEMVRQAFVARQAMRSSRRARPATVLP